MSDTAVNPTVVGPLDTMPELMKVPVAASQTYRKGTPYYMSGGQATVCVDDAIPAGQFAHDVTTAVAANTLVEVYKWSVGVRLEIFVVASGTASTIANSNLGLAYDLEMVGTAPNEVAYMDKDATTDKIFLVLDCAANYENLRNAAADSPGKCVVQVLKVQDA